jgi:hypothetical protein
MKNRAYIKLVLGGIGIMLSLVFIMFLGFASLFTMSGFSTYWLAVNPIILSVISLDIILLFLMIDGICDLVEK